MENTKKIFNISQADLFKKSGCNVVGFGLGRKKKVYVEFEVNDLFLEMLKRWENKEFPM